MAEDRYVKGNARSLEGIPLAVKDESYIEGKITTNASLLLQDNVAKYTSPIIGRVLEAGAIVHARTTTPEFSIAGVTWSAKDKATVPKGGTGFGVRLLDRLVADNYEA